MFTGRPLEGVVVSATPRTAQAPPSTTPRARGPGYKLCLPLTRGRERDLVPSTYQRPAAKRPESVLLSVLLYSKSSSGVVTCFAYARWLGADHPPELPFKMTTDYRGGFASSQSYLKPGDIGGGMYDGTSSESSAASPLYSNVRPERQPQLYCS
jgi:hypothetical protein